MLKLSIIGQDTLAAATVECCRLHFAVSTYPDSDADVLWFCYDTPIGADDKPDAEWVIDRIREQLVDLGTKPLILISSQIPVGTTARLEQEFSEHVFACQPENIRVASAVADFMNQARIVVGTRTTKHDAIIKELFAPFTKNLIMTTPETAECVKHFLNVFLALNIAFANEFARVCAVVGANAIHVSEALRCEPRISPKAPLRPGAPYGGGHLARDIYVVTELARQHGISIPIISHIKESNGGPR
jgi:UDPglucose 6-dehydrogenase